MRASRCLILFSKPPVAGRVKTRLVGGRLSADDAAALHAAFLGDLCERLTQGEFELRVAWAIEEHEVPPDLGVRSASPQHGHSLGDRLFNGLREQAERFDVVAAIGSDHPDLDLALVERAFAAVERGADVVFGPATDGGYYLVALRSSALRRELFQGIAWSTGEVLTSSVARCRDLDLTTELLSAASDVDTPDDLRRLEERLRAGGIACPRTEAVLERLAAVQS